MALESFVFEGLDHSESRMSIRSAEIPATRFTSVGFSHQSEACHQIKFFEGYSVSHSFSFYVFILKADCFRSSVEWLPYFNQLHFDSVSFQETVLAGWLFFAPLLNHNVCHPRGFENCSSVFIWFVCVYLSIFNLYDNVGGGRI